MRAAVVAASCLLILAACGPRDEAEPADMPAATDTGIAAGTSLAEFAGTWENMARLDGTPEPVPSTMTGSAAGDDWTMSLQGRENIPLQVSIVGDSLVSQSAEYESVLRPGVMVSVRTAAVRQGDTMTGTLVATYRTPDGEQRVNGTIEGRRVR